MKNSLIEKQFHSLLVEYMVVSLKITLFKTTFKTTKLGVLCLFITIQILWSIRLDVM